MTESSIRRVSPLTMRQTRILPLLFSFFLIFAFFAICQIRAENKSQVRMELRKTE